MAKSKVCKRCGVEKEVKGNFSKRFDSPDGVHRYCKECLSLEGKKRYQEKREAINEKNKAYYYNNLPDRLDYAKDYYEKNKEKKREWYQKNREKVLARMKEKYKRVDNAKGK